MVKCIFCEIVEKKATARIIAENDGALCFLILEPLTKGHCLVVPKKHFTDIFDIDESSLSEVAALAKEMSLLLKKKLGATGVNILHASGKSAQQSVFHFHLHIVPRFENDGLDAWPKSEYKELSLDDVKKSLLL